MSLLLLGTACLQPKYWVYCSLAQGHLRCYGLSIKARVNLFRKSSLILFDEATESIKF